MVQFFFAQHPKKSTAAVENRMSFFSASAPHATSRPGFGFVLLSLVLVGAASSYKAEAPRHMKTSLFLWSSSQD